MANSTTKNIGIGTTFTIFLLLAWFGGRPDILTEVGPDIACAGTMDDLCYGTFSLTSLNKTIYFYNKNASNNLLIETDKPVKLLQLCINDGRYKNGEGLCPKGFREIELNEKFSKGASYVLKLEKGKKRDFVLVGLKNNPSEDIEWFANKLGPVWLGDINPAVIVGSGNITLTGSNKISVYN